MRVIGGEAGGHRLKAVEGRATRPTTDRVRESIFGILAGRCLDARVLDLFAGTGSLGIEALSRGAAYALFVENGRSAKQVVRENLLATGLSGRGELLVMDFLKALSLMTKEQSATGGLGFDLVFVDPPYGKGLAVLALERLAAAPVLNVNAVLVVEHSAHDELSASYGALERRRVEKYGETIVSFYQLTKKGGDQ